MQSFHAAANSAVTSGLTMGVRGLRTLKRRYTLWARWRSEEWLNNGQLGMLGVKVRSETRPMVDGDANWSAEDSRPPGPASGGSRPRDCGNGFPIAGNELTSPINRGRKAGHTLT
ncbi:hypothetical protein PSAB6_50093 [Paraburkholderia sabiae]|nr:hypothetical protein PSAB6_50093 [Paraburkholderia sabiae]